jgi:hypothetical protein
MEAIASIALAAGAAWASGINVYAVIFMLGVLGSTGYMTLPAELEILTNPVVIAAAGLMYFIEFFADKMPGVDTGWDAIHTFIRIPAGATLAAAALGDMDPAVQIAAFIVGGGLAATSHATKAGSRVVINISPEPVTNWTASIVEDLVVFAGLWTALNYPVVFLVLLVLFLVTAAWLLPKLWRGIRKIGVSIKQFFQGTQADDLSQPTAPEELEHSSSANQS